MVRVRYRWFRRYGPKIKTWFKVYPWHVQLFKVQPWTLELGNHWKAEKVYLCLAKNGDVYKNGTNPPKFYYWRQLYVPNHSKG